MPVLLSLPHAARAFARRCWQQLCTTLRPPARPASALELLRSLSPDCTLALDNKQLDTVQARQHLVAHFRARTIPRFFIDSVDIRSGIAEIQRAHPDWRAKLAQRVAAYRPGSSATDAASQDQIERDREHLLHFSLDISRALLHGDAEPAWLRNKLGAWLNTIELNREPAAYSSPLLAVFRAISISWSLAFLSARGQQDTLDIEFDLLRILLGDANFIASQLGDSFPNNHLLADGFALWYLGTLYPEFSSAAHWRTAGEKVWLHELSRQIYADGASFEHAQHYHNFACEMACVYVLIEQRNGRKPTAVVLDKLRPMLQFQSALGQFGATPPQPGDSGDATLIPLDTAQHGLCMAYSILGRVLFQINAPLHDTQHPALERAFWLLGAQLPIVEDTLPSTYPAHFPQGGFTFFSDERNRHQLLFRTGPAPDLELNPGHMHADLLSLYLSIEGEPAIIESGTYTYGTSAKVRLPREGGGPGNKFSQRINDSLDPRLRGDDGKGAFADLPYRATPETADPNWREYFLSAYAHNGFCINGHDPLARGPGNFPSKPIQSRVTSANPQVSDSLVLMRACITSTTPYDGYCRSVLQIKGKYWLVSDLLPAGSAQASVGWQFSAAAKVTLLGNGLNVSLAHSHCALAMCGGQGRLKVLDGSFDPLGGWVSPRYGELQSAPMARWHVTLGLPIAVGTVLVPDAIPPSIEGGLLEGGGAAYRIDSVTDIDYVLLATSESNTIEFSGIHFVGRALWLRMRNGLPLEVRWLDGVSLAWPEHNLYLRAQQQIAGLHIYHPSYQQPNGHTLHADLIESRWP